MQVCAKSSQITDELLFNGMTQNQKYGKSIAVQKPEPEVLDIYRKLGIKNPLRDKIYLATKTKNVVPNKNTDVDY